MHAENPEESRIGRPRGAARAASLLLFCGLTIPAAADAVWISTGGGNWGTSGNWQSGTLPSSGQNTHFDNRVGGTSFTYAVAMTDAAGQLAARDLFVRANDVTLNFASATQDLTLNGPTPTLTVGGHPWLARLTILNTTGTTRTLSGYDASIGAANNQTAEMIVRGASARASFTRNFKVGALATPSTNGVLVDQGAGLTVGSLQVGAAALTTNTLTISGAGSTVTYTGFGVDGCYIGDGGAANVVIQNGGILRSQPSVYVPTRIAFANPSAGPVHVFIDGAGSQWIAAYTGLTTFSIAANGRTADVVLTNGGLWTTSTTSHTWPVLIGNQSQGKGTVQIGAGSIWAQTGSILAGYNTAATPTTGEIRLLGGQLMVTGANSAANLLASGRLSGHGTVAPGVGLGSNGTITPDHESTTYGTLAITGTFSNQNAGSFSALAGRVELDVRGDDSGPHDTITVSGLARLGGMLTVRSAGSVPDPGNTMSLPLITAGAYSTTDPTFRVAFLPSLPDNRFFRVSYPGPGGGAITLNVQALFNSPSFDGGPASSTLNATVTAADRGDLDNDGLDDLAVTTSDGFLFLLKGNGDGTFGQVTQLPVGNDPRGVVVADLDPTNPNNNGLDVIVSNSADDTLTVYTRDANAAWFVVATPATGTTPMGLCSADLDGDGWRDLAVANQGSDNVSFLRGQSSAFISIAAQTQHATDNGPVDVDPWDPDNTKGTRSLVTSNATAGTMSLLVNNGSGFNAPVNFSSGAGAFQVVTGDFNLDGYSDAATLNADGTMTVFICDGAGSFLNGAPVPVGDNPLSFARADLDLDGDLDLAVIAENDSDNQTVKIFRNDTDPADNNLVVASPSEVATPTPQIVLTGKVDADTRPDIITVGSGLRSTTTIASVANSSPCPSDYDRNSWINGDDFDGFMAAFDLGDITSDFDHNGFVNGDDFDFFTHAFDQGC